MVLRDISAKQIGGNDFSPREVDIGNFSKAQLAAIYRLSNEGKNHITNKSYEELPGYDMGEVRDGRREARKAYDKTDRKNLGQYFSPAAAISTSLGRATVSKDKKSGDNVLNDIYDFDKYVGNKKIHQSDLTRSYYDEKGNYVGPKYLIDDVIDEQVKLKSTPYGRLRGAVGKYGHNSGDPESSRIHVKLNMSDVKKKIGDDYRKIDVNEPMSRSGWVWRGAGAGALTMMPVGAALGAIAGAMRLVSKKNRKKWLMTMLIHTLGGAGIGALAGAAGGSYAFNKVWNKFEKKSSAGGDAKTAKKAKKRSKDKRERGLNALGMSLAYSIPPLALASLLGYGLYKYNKLNSKTLDRPYTKSDVVDIVEPPPKKENADA